MNLENFDKVIDSFGGRVTVTISSSLKDGIYHGIACQIASVTRLRRTAQIAGVLALLVINSLLLIGAREALDDARTSSMFIDPPEYLELSYPPPGEPAE